MDGSSSARPNSLAKLLATGLYSGYAPVAPGTAGSLVGLVLYWLAGLDRAIPGGAAILALLIVGAAVSAAMERALGNDPPQVVIDEIAGMWISLLLLPKTVTVALAGFILFRLFDIFKPPPARNVEAIKGGWGIMLDDVVAGLYANLLLRLLVALWPKFLGLE